MTGKVIAPSIRGQRRAAAAWIVAALGLALLAAYTTHSYLEQQEERLRQAATPPDTGVEVIVAADALAAGEVLAMPHLAVRSFPADLLTQDAVNPADVDAVLGKALVQALPSGRPLTYAMLYQSTGNRLARLLRVGERAMSLPLSDTDVDGSTLEAGATVDLVLVEKGKGVAGSLLKESAVLLAVNGLTAADQSNPNLAAAPLLASSITVAITPDEADRMVRASARLNANEARLLVLLRHPDDHSRPYVAAPQQAPVHTVTVFEGGRSSNGQLTPNTHAFGTGATNRAIYGDLNRAAPRVLANDKDGVREVSDVR